MAFQRQICGRHLTQSRRCQYGCQKLGPVAVQTVAKFGALVFRIFRTNPFVIDTPSLLQIYKSSPPVEAPNLSVRWLEAVALAGSVEHWDRRQFNATEHPALKKNNNALFRRLDTTAPRPHWIAPRSSIPAVGSVYPGLPVEIRFA